MRVKRGITVHKRHKKILDAAKGFRGRGSTCYRIARGRLEKGWQYAYRDRKVKKREFRQLWIIRVNAACRNLTPELTYSRFMHIMSQANIDVNNKMISEMSIHDAAAFKVMVQQAINVPVNAEKYPNIVKALAA